MANWKHCPAVAQSRGKDGDVWVFSGTSVPLHRLYEALAGGDTADDFARRFGVDVEQAAGALEYEADELHDYRLDYRGAVPYARNPRADRIGADDTLWRNCPLVEQARGRLGGAWVFKHSRLALYTLYYHLAGGSTLDEFDEWYGMDTAKVIAVLKHEAGELQKGGVGYAHIV